MKIRQKPIELDAIQIPYFIETDRISITQHAADLGCMFCLVEAQDELEEWTNHQVPGTLIVWVKGVEKTECYWVESATLITLEGRLDFEPGDMIITNPGGEKTVCRAALFPQLYDFD